MFLRQDQVDFYRQNGFLIVEGALTACAHTSRLGAEYLAESAPAAPVRHGRGRCVPDRALHRGRSERVAASRTHEMSR